MSKERTSPAGHGCDAVDRVLEKHEDLHSAVLGLKEVLVRLDGLMGRICGPRPESETKNPAPPENVTLATVLNDDPVQIRADTDAALLKIEEINALLF